MEKKLVPRRIEKNPNKGMESLLNVHTRALEDNSASVVEILEILSQKDLSRGQKASLGKIKKELKSIDNRLDKLGSQKKKSSYENDLFDL